MKKIGFLFVLASLILSCKNDVVQKPDKLIEQDQMVNIIYDLAVLDAMKTAHPQMGGDISIDQKAYIYKKYAIDSLQFAKSNQYYAADIANYKRMYDEVSKRLTDEQKAAEAVVGKGSNTPAEPLPDAPQVQ